MTKDSLGSFGKNRFGEGALVQLNVAKQRRVLAQVSTKALYVAALTSKIYWSPARGYRLTRPPVKPELRQRLNCHITVDATFSGTSMRSVKRAR
jgi:hypothetical protein